jgi:multisubunit Na+/H+ antiporter MnhB subunit
VTPFYEASAKALTGAKDIVGAIIVDFRALDTLIEITVFGLAGLGVYTLLRYAAKKSGEGVQTPPAASHLATLGIGGPETSAFVHALAYVSLPLSMLIAVVHMIYGHDQPGDGFTAGVIVSLALGFWYVVFGYYEVRQRLTWLRPAPLIAGGLLLVLVSATAAALLTGSFLGHVDFGQRLGLPLPRGFYLSTSFLFEVAICLAVLGSASYLLDTLGHPGEEVQ